MSFSLGKRFENLIIIALFLTDFKAIKLAKFINHLRYWSQIRLFLFFLYTGTKFCEPT